MADSQMSSTSSEPPWKKRKSSKDLTSNPSLPDDLTVSILARVSGSYYPKLFLVSKSFRSILASPQLHQTRRLLGKTDNLLYVCLRFPDEANLRWFTLYRKPYQTLTTKKKNKKEEDSSSVNLLASISILNSPSVELSDIISVGHNLYGISEKAPYSYNSNVPFLDCRTHTWHEAPRMRLAHTNSSVFEGRMYLPGSSEKPDSLNCVEVYNTKTQTWKPVPPEKRIFEFENLEGKVYYENFGVVSSGQGLILSSKLERLKYGSYKRSSCMIEHIDFCYWQGDFHWREMAGVVVYRKLNGLEGLPKFSRYSYVKLAEYGDKLVVLWDNYVHESGYKEKMIWCAEISLEKRNNEEMWGKVEWFDAVLRVPKSCEILCATAVTL